MSRTKPATRSNTNILLREDQDGVTTLTLNRPESGNSLSHALVDELQETFQEIALDANVRSLFSRRMVSCSAQDTT